jgi:hypothetical protein
VLLTAAIAALMITPSALAAEPPEDGLPIGPWTAAAYADGRAVIKAKGMKVDWRGEIPAQFTFDVSDDGKAKGTWVHQGDARQVISGKVAGRKVRGTADIAFSGGGKLGGTNESLRLTGSSRQTGDLTLKGAGGSVSYDVSQRSKVPRLKLPVSAATCSEAYGEWAYTLKQAIERQGFKASMAGYWLGFRDTEEAQAQAGRLLEASHQQGPEAQALDSSSELLTLAAGLLRRYNDFVDRFPDWTIDEVSVLFGETEAVLNVLRNLTECERRLFGEDNVEQFFNGLTFILQNLILQTSTLTDLPAETWQSLVQASLRSGAIGPGAANPAEAAAAEQALIDAAEAILDRSVDPADDRIVINDETIMAMGTSAAMGWTLDVRGTTYDARETWTTGMDGAWPQVP